MKNSEKVKKKNQLRKQINKQTTITKNKQRRYPPPQPIFQNYSSQVVFLFLYQNLFGKYESSTLLKLF